MAKLKKRDDGRYTVTATINGKRKFFYGKTRAEAQEKCEAYKQKSQGIAYFNEDITILEWAEEWLQMKESTVTPNTLDSYVQPLRNHIIPEIGHMKLCELTPVIVRRLLSKKLKTLSTRSVRYIYTILNAMIAQAVKDEIIPKNVVAIVQKPKLVKTHEIVTLSAAEVKAFLAGIENPDHHAFFTLAFASGMRRSELLGLTWHNVDFKNNTILVDKTVLRVGNDIVLSKTTKNSSSRRSIKLDAETMAELKKQSLRVKKRMFSAANWTNNDLVFPRANGQPLAPTYPSALCKKYAASIGKPAFTLHGTRHTHATLLIQAGVNFKVIQARLGHSSFNETMNTYSHLTPVLEFDAADTFEKILS